MKKTIVVDIYDIDSLPVSFSDGFWKDLIDSIEDAKSGRPDRIVITIETE